MDAWSDWKYRAKGKQRLWEILTAAIVLSFWKLPLNSFCQHLFDEKRKGIYIFNLYFQIKTLLKTVVYIFIFIYTKYKKPLFWYRIVICQSLGSPTPSVNSWFNAWSRIGKAIRVMLYDGWCSCRRIRFPLICSLLKLNTCRKY